MKLRIENIPGVGGLPKYESKHKKKRRHTEEDTVIPTPADATFEFSKEALELAEKLSKEKKGDEEDLVA